MPVLANRNRGYKPQPATPEVMIHYLDTIASPEMEREGLLPAFTTLFDMSQNTLSIDNRQGDIVDRRDRPDITGKAEIFE
jgi:hypothetical protein